MKATKNEVSKIKPPKGFFENSVEGRIVHKPAMHKDGTPYSDLDYLELLGRKCIELEKEAPNGIVNYNQLGYDANVVAVAKDIVNELDKGTDRKVLSDYVASIIDINC